MEKGNLSKMDIGGALRPVGWGMNTWILYCELRGCTITDMGEQLQRIGTGGGSGSEIRDLIWAALKSGARKEKQDVEFDNWDVGDWLDDISTEALTEFLTSMTESMQERIPSDNGATKKKKVPVKYPSGT